MILAAGNSKASETPVSDQQRAIIPVQLGSSSHWHSNEPHPLKLEVTVPAGRLATGRYFDVWEGTIAVSDANGILDAGLAVKQRAATSPVKASTAAGAVTVDSESNGHVKRLLVERMYHRWEADWYD